MAIMNVCVTVNSKYMRYLYTMLLSLYKNNKRGSICLYVIQRDFTEENKKTILDLTEQYENWVKYIWIDEHKFDSMPVYTKERKNLSLEIYFRLLIPELIPDEIDKILMLDVDIVVNHSIEELYALDMSKKCLGAAPNMCANFIVDKTFRKWYPKDRTHWIHYNTGVLMWNLKRIREKYPREYLFQMAFKHKIETSTFEEELFNVEFGENEIFALDPLKWNYISTRVTKFDRPNFEIYRSQEDLKENCSIVHYAGLNPWEAGVKDKSFLLWWDYAKETPYYCAFLEEQLRRTEKYLCDISKKDRNMDQVIDLQILSLLFRLKGTSELEQFLNREETELYLWGAGEMGERFYQMLLSVNSEGKLAGVIDEKKSGRFHGLEIWKKENFLEYTAGRNGKIIVTPIKAQSEFAAVLTKSMPSNVEIVTLRDYLGVFSDKYIGID